MTSPIRRLAKESAVYGISTIAARFLNFLLTPFYTQVFLPSEFGVVSTWFSLIAFLNILFQFGLPQSYLRFAADLSQKDQSSLFTRLQLVLVLIGLTFSAIFYLFHEPVLGFLEFPAGSLHLAGWVLLILILDSLSWIPFNQLRLKNQSGTFSSVKLLNVVVNLSANLVFILILKTGIEGVFYANILASAATLITVSLLTRESLTVPSGFEIKNLAPVLLFAIPLIPTGFGTMFNEVADRLFIQNLSAEVINRIYPDSGLSPQDLVGFYSAGHKLGLLMFLVVQMFSMAWTPFFLQESKTPDFPASLSRLLNMMLVFLGGSGFLMAFFMDDLLSISVNGVHLIPPSYWQGLVVVPWVVLAYVFNGLYVFFSYGLFLEKQSGLIFGITAAGVLVTLLGNQLLLPVMGIAGSGATVLLCYLVMAAGMAFASVKRRPFPVDSGFLLRWLVVMVPVWGVVFWHYLGEPIPLVYKVLITLVWVGLIFIFRLWTVNLLKLFLKRN